MHAQLHLYILPPRAKPQHPVRYRCRGSGLDWEVWLSSQCFAEGRREERRVCVSAPKRGGLGGFVAALHFARKREASKQALGLGVRDVQFVVRLVTFFFFFFFISPKIF